MAEAYQLVNSHQRASWKVMRRSRVQIRFFGCEKCVLSVIVWQQEVFVAKLGNRNKHTIDMFHVFSCNSETHPKYGLFQSIDMVKICIPGG